MKFSQVKEEAKAIRDKIDSFIRRLDTEIISIDISPVKTEVKKRRPRSDKGLPRKVTPTPSPTPAKKVVVKRPTPKGPVKKPIIKKPITKPTVKKPPESKPGPAKIPPLFGADPNVS